MTLRRATLAIAGSIAAHGAALAALAYGTVPEPSVDQTMPKTAMTIASQQVKRTSAPQAEAAGEAAQEDAASATAARQGAVPQAAAAPIPVAAPRLPATKPAAPTAAPQAQAARPLTATALTAPSLTDQSTNGPALAALPPVAAKAEAHAPNAALLVPSLAASAKVNPQEPTSTVAQQPPLPVQIKTAALAWSGEGDTVVSATSLAAIAAFSQQGDLSDQSKQVRDGIAGILAAVPCARLQTVFNPDTGNLELTGHIPEDALRGPVLAALRAQVGDAIPLSDNLLILPRPQCGALTGIADIDLPQSTEQLTNPRVIGQDGFAQNYTYSDGQTLQLDLAGPDYDSFIYVDYFVADGTVIHLQPNDVVPLRMIPAKAPMSVGRDRDDQPFLLLTIRPPFGQEIAAAFATSVPLYDGPRPVQDPAGPYLIFLKSKVADARARDPDFKGEWVYFFITTQPG